MNEDELRPRKSPRQARSTATVEVILEAATRVLSEESLGGFNTNRIAEVAGVSVGSLYQYFPNKASLVAALVERTQSALADAVEKRVAERGSKPLSTVIRELADLAIEQQFGNPTLAAALDHEERRLPVDPVVGNAQARMVRSIQALFAGYDFSAQLPASAAIDCVVMVKAVIDSEAGNPAPDVDELRARILRALLGYLKLDR